VPSGVARLACDVATVARITYEALPPALRERFAPRVRRLGYLGEFFSVGAHQPGALGAFFDFTEALKAALPARLVEVIALTVSRALDNDYERVQHEHLALTGILSADEVRTLVALEDASAFAPAERAAIDLARTFAATPDPKAFERLRELTDDAVAVACAMTAARYLAHAAMARCWRLQAPRRSPFEGAA
jgi:alkylhydroperoxidase family enzyme